MNTPFKLIMVSAAVEMGGNVTHRHFDQHPSCLTFPFENMLGTPISSNIADAWVPYRYRYSSFTTEMTPREAYQSIYDEEVKTYLRTPYRSKFKDCGMVMDEAKRIEAFERICDEIAPSSGGEWPDRNTRANYVEAYFRSTMDSWENLVRSGKETHHVGYLPWILFDTDRLMADFPDCHIVHVTRNPWSGYSHTLHRPFPLPLTQYCQLWNLASSHALTYRRKYAGQFHTVRYEDLISDKRAVMSRLLTDLVLPWSDNVLYPSFNGKDLSESVRPWGTLTTITPEANLATALELTEDQIEATTIECYDQLKVHGYQGPHSGSLI